MSDSAASRAALDRIAQIVAEYSRTHGVDVWVWDTNQAGTRPVINTGNSSPARPGPSSAPIKTPDGGELRVEIADATEAGSGGRCRFLASLLSDSLRADSESRFLGREIAERYEEITLLYSISEILGSVITLEDAAHTILREVSDTMGVSRAALWIFEPQSELLRLVAAVGGDPPSGPIPVNDDRSITAVVFRERRPMILEADDVYPRHGHSPTNRDSFLAVPVNYTPPRGEPRTIGVINLVGRRFDEGFSAGDHKLITAIASQIGAAVENSRLVAQSLQQERMVRELELAHDLQLKLLPSVEQFRDRADVAARCIPAESVGGDFYHLLRLPHGCFGVMIGDVSSHGFGAALIMALTMSAVAIHASEGDPPAEVLRRIHRTLVDELETTEMYMTLFYGVIDPRNHRLAYANAGHSHAFGVSRNGQVRRLAVTNPPLGIVDPDTYQEASVPWTPSDDLLLLFTDGLADLLGPGVGEQRLLDRVVASRDKPLDSIVQSLFDMQAAPNGIPSDDRTAVLVRV